ncbi:MAG: FKBP-type peptidyl-prolyl cis-trans isomerase [Pseudomonadota bacterium]
MKKFLGLLIIIVIVSGFTLCCTKTEQKQAPVEKKLVLQSNEDKVSYAIGFSMGDSLNKQKIQVNMDALVDGMKSALGVSAALLTEDEMQKVLYEFQKEQMSKMMKEREESGEVNKAEADKFLEENKAKEGIKITASGLQYKVINEGTGKKPIETSQVKVHYEGTLVSGEVFDSSYKRGEPATFGLNGVIKGWTEGLQLMKEGAKYMFYIPSELAYGERGAGDMIGPNATLIFTVELLEVLDK